MLSTARRRRRRALKVYALNGGGRNPVLLFRRRFRDPTLRAAPATSYSDTFPRPRPPATTADAYSLVAPSISCPISDPHHRATIEAACCILNFFFLIKTRARRDSCGIIINNCICARVSSHRSTQYIHCYNMHTRVISLRSNCNVRDEKKIKYIYI